MESITSQEGARIPGARREALRKQAAEKGLSVPANLVAEVKKIAEQG